MRLLPARQTLAAVSLLESDPAPDDAAIDDWMSGNLCRCGTYPGSAPRSMSAADTLASGPNRRPSSLRRDRDRSGSRPRSWLTPSIRTFGSGGRDDRRVLEPDRDGAGNPHRLATIVAEELDADFDSVRVVNAANGRGPNGDVYGNPDLGSAFQLTGASNSMKGFWVRYRLAAAQARARLVAAAAEAWDVPAGEVEIENGVLRHAAEGRRRSPSSRRRPSSFRSLMTCSRRTRPTTS